MKRKLAAALACLCIVFSSCAFADWSVTDFGAMGDGKTDDTQAFNSAMTAANAAGGGTVKVPAGKYCVKGNLVVPDAVTLEGTWNMPRQWDKAGGRTWSIDQTYAQGTLLLAYAGRGSNTGTPFITLAGSGSTVKGLGVYYPECSQKTVPPVPYPPCIANLAPDGNNIGIINCSLLNPYEGIRLDGSARFLISNVQGYPSWRGIFVDSCYDIGRIENVHFWPFGIVYNAKDPYCEWINKNGTAFEFARTDWQYMTNTFCFGYGVGYKFSKSKSGSCNGSFLCIGADSCRRAVEVNAIQEMGIAITNGEFVGRWTSEDSLGVDIRPGANGRVGLVNCAFWGPLDVAVSVNSPNAVLCAEGCNFQHWDNNLTDAPALNLIRGKASVVGCSFVDGYISAKVGKDMGASVFSGNLSDDGVRIKNEGSKRLVTSGNESPRPEMNAYQRKYYKVNIGTRGDIKYIHYFNQRESSAPEWKDSGTKRWSMKDSQLMLPAIKGKKYSVLIDMNVPKQAFSPDMGVYYNGKLVARPTKEGLCVLKASITAVSDTVKLVVKCKPWSPADLSNTPDTRVLGVGIKSVTMQMEGASGVPINANNY